ncbi:MFS transporter [Nonomuraea sp. NPDC050310]|uniref:MFS transporter n=1 Tax=unclassified Nonomuraea TaxID=2593643 RepID=UPI0033CD9B3F
MASSPHDLRYAWRVCSVASLGLILIGIAGSTLNVALPVVVRHFRATPLESGWILLSYLLVMTASMVFFGRVADLLGRRETYLAGFALFTVASLLAGFAPNVWFLVAMRVLQAAAAAMILANGAVIITHAFPPDKLSRGMGVYIGTLSVAQLAGPSLGGLIAETAGWQWIFWVNVPAGVIAVILGMLVLRKVPRGPRRPVDALGNLLIFAALCAALLAVSEPDTFLYGGAALCLVLVPLIVLVEKRSSHPVLDKRLFAGKTLIFGNAASFCNALARAALVLLAALHFQAARGMDAFTAGLCVLPVAVGMAIASPVAGLLRASPYAITVGGSLFSAAGLGLLMVFADPEVPYWPIGVALFLAGCGSGAFLTGNTTQMMSALPSDSLGVVNGLRVMIMNVGIVLSVGVSLSMLTSSVSPAVRDQVYAATLDEVSPVAVAQLMDGFRLTYAVLFGVALVGAVLSALARDPNRKALDPVDEVRADAGHLPGKLDV